MKRIICAPVAFLIPERREEGAALAANSDGESPLAAIDGEGVATMDNGISLVFVYGTLLSGECNHEPYLADSERVGGPARLAAQLWDTSRGYPAVVMHANGQDDARYVRGELYRVTPETLARLDELEDYYGPGAVNEYERVEAEVEVEVEAEGKVEAGGARHRACVYVYVSPPPQGLRIDSGDWRSYRPEGCK